MWKKRKCDDVVSRDSWGVQFPLLQSTDTKGISVEKVPEKRWLFIFSCFENARQQKILTKTINKKPRKIKLIFTKLSSIPVSCKVEVQ